MHKPSNAPAPHDLLLTAREALKSVLKNPDADHDYTILMAMNAMGIAARAMHSEPPPPVQPGGNDEGFRQWVREADRDTIMNRRLIHSLRRHVSSKLAVSNPRFKPESGSEDNP